jgi:hypothetical protein
VLRCGNHAGQDECDDLEDEDVFGHWSGSHSLNGVLYVMCERKVLLLAQTERVTLWKPLECLSRMTGNCHVRFLGGLVNW